MNRQDMVFIYTRFALQHPLQLYKCELLRCPVAAKHLWRVFTSAFFTNGSSQLSNKFA